MPHQIAFNVAVDQYPPEFAVVTGYIVIEWTLIANSVEKLLHTFLSHDPAPPKEISMAFERQGDLLKSYVQSLYVDSPAEFDEYQRVFGQVMSIKRKRDAVAHGIPSTCTYRGKTFPALWVTNWTVSKKSWHLPATVTNLKNLAEQASRLKQEWCWVEGVVRGVFLRKIREQQIPPSVRDKHALPKIESLLNNPLRNPKPVKSPQPPASPLRWPRDTADWQTALPYTPAKGSIIQTTTAILLQDVLIESSPRSSHE